MSKSMTKLSVVMNCFFLFSVSFFIPTESFGVDLAPPIVQDLLYDFSPRIDYEGVRFLELDTTVFVIEDVRDSTYTGYKLPFLKKGLRIERDADVRPGTRIHRIPYDKFLIQEIKSKTHSEKRFFTRIKKIITPNDLKGFVHIRSAFEALEFLRWPTSDLSGLNFSPGMLEVFCVSNFVETAPEVSGISIASMEECRQNGFAPPEGPFDLVIADVESKVEGSLSMTGREVLNRLVESFHRTTTSKKKVEIEFEKRDGPVKVKTEGELTQEEEALVSSLVAVVQEAHLKVEIEIEAEVNEEKIPKFFVITRTAFAGGAFVKLTEEVGQDGSWRILDKKIIAPLTDANFKFYIRH